MKRWICLIMAAILSALTLAACSAVTEEDASTPDEAASEKIIAAYDAFAEENGVMPTLQDLGDYESIKAAHHTDSVLGYKWEAYTIIVTYDESLFDGEVEYAGEQFKYQEETVQAANGPELKPEFELDGYEFHLLDLKEYSENRPFPQRVYFIGFNEEESKAAYVCLFDDDLDTATTMKSLLKLYCDWGAIK